MDDIIFGHKPRLLDVTAQLKRSAHAALGLAINCAVIPVAGQRMHGTTFRVLKITSKVATPLVEPAGLLGLDSVTAIVFFLTILFLCCLLLSHSQASFL